MLFTLFQKPEVDLPAIVQRIRKAALWTQPVINREHWYLQGVRPNPCIVLVTAGAHGHKSSSMDMHDDHSILSELLNVLPLCVLDLLILLAESKWFWIVPYLSDAHFHAFYCICVGWCFQQAWGVVLLYVCFPILGEVNWQWFRGEQANTDVQVGVIHLWLVIQEWHAWKPIWDITFMVQDILPLWVLVLNCSILDWLYISLIGHRQYGIEHRHINQMVDLDRRKHQLVKVFEVLVVQLVPEVKYLLAVINFPALQLIPCLAFLVEDHEEASIRPWIEALGDQVAPFLFTSVTCISKSQQKLELFVYLEQPLLCFNSWMSPTNLIIYSPVSAAILSIENVLERCPHCLVQHLIAEIYSLDAHIYPLNCWLTQRLIIHLLCAPRCCSVGQRRAHEALFQHLP